MNRVRAKSLQDAILAAFVWPDNDELARSFEPFDLGDWKTLGTWLHASGLALYFLREVRTRSLCGVIPPQVLESLQQNQIDNSKRTDSLMSEFIHLNDEFRSAQLDYCNVKGFSLGREYCPNPSLRSQFDLDFWVREDQALDCEALMHGLGYQTIAATKSTLEFRSGEESYPKFAKFYKARRERSVEVHLRPEKEMRERSRGIGWIGDYGFPSLSPGLTFVVQAQHLTKHLRHEWTRASWMLELRNAVLYWKGDAEFWRAVRGICPSDDALLAVGIALEATTTVFPTEIPEPVTSWSTGVLAPNVVRWIREYAKTVVTAQFPGSKLYLILESELTRNSDEFKKQRRSRLVPLHAAGVAVSTRSRTLRSFASHAKFLSLRFAFHVREGLRLLREETRWKRFAKLLSCPEHQSAGSALGQARS